MAGCSQKSVDILCAREYEYQEPSRQRPEELYESDKDIMLAIGRDLVKMLRKESKEAQEVKTTQAAKA